MGGFCLVVEFHQGGSATNRATRLEYIMCGLAFKLHLKRLVYKQICLAMAAVHSGISFHFEEFIIETVKR